MDSDCESVSSSELIPDTFDIRPLYFFGVNGYQGRLNDALFKPALPFLVESNFPQKTLVFFGGDVQNFMHLMDQNNSNINYRQWCLEAAASRLGRDFPNHHIVVIKPTRVTFDHISCFYNFVDGDALGNPTHTYRYVGLPHLEELLKTISKKIKQMDSEELFKMLHKRQDEEDLYDEDCNDNIVRHWQYNCMSSKSKRFLKRWQEVISLDKYPLTLVGFCKGCTVLNQFLYEFDYAKRLEPRMQDSSFIDRIETMYYLDASHSGTRNVYVTSRCMLRILVDLCIKVYIHMSQYQIDDRDRPHIRMQCIMFIKVLQEFKADLAIYRHTSTTADLAAHIGVLLNFMTAQRSNIELRDTLLPPWLPPPPEPSAPESGPAPPPPPPRERNPLFDEVLGISLIKTNQSPHFGIQTILRRPLNVIMDNIMASKRASPETDTEATDITENDTDTQEDDADDSESDDQSHVTRTEQVSENTGDFDEDIEQISSNIEHLAQNMEQYAQYFEHVVQNSGPVAQNIAQPALNPEHLALNFEPVAQNIAQAALNSHSDSVMDSVFASNNSYIGQGAGTSQLTNFSPEPGTSHSFDTLQVDNSYANTFTYDHLHGNSQPSLPPVPVNSVPSTSSCTSEAAKQFSNFTVCMTVKNDRFDFQSDKEALEIFENAKYFQLDHPVVAIVHDRDELPGIDIFMPEERIHTARVLNRIAPDLFERMERAAASLQSSSGSDSPPSVSGLNNVPSALGSGAPQNILLSALQGNRLPRTDDASRRADSNGGSSVEHASSYPWIVANDTSRRNTYRDVAPLNATDATLHVNIALDSTNRARTVSVDNSAPNSQPDSVVSNFGDSSDVVMEDPLQMASQAQTSSNYQAIAGTSGIAQSSTGAIPRVLRVRRNSARASSTPYNLN